MNTRGSGCDARRARRRRVSAVTGVVIGLVSMSAGAVSADSRPPGDDGIAHALVGNQSAPAPAALDPSPPDAAAAVTQPAVPSPPAAPSPPPGVLAVVLAGVSLALILGTGWYRLHRAPARPVALTLLAAVFLLAITYLLGSVGVGIAQLAGVSVQPDAQGTVSIEAMAKMRLAVTLASLIGVGVFVMLVGQARPPSPDRRASGSRAIVMAIAALMLVWPLVHVSLGLTAWLTGAPADQFAHDLLRTLASAPLNGWSLLLMALVTVAGPTIEEVMYRGMLQEGLRRAGFSPWPAIALASVFFALAHIGTAPFHALVGLLVLALGLGWAYEKTGRLLTPIIMHAIFNAANLLLARAMLA